MNRKRFKTFQATVLDYYNKAGRQSLPWRHTRDPYHILVSEIMLQQTQVSRALKKYPEFLAAFPTVESLARAPIAQVLHVWQGLGYNRRALNLKRAAQTVVLDFKGEFPKTARELESLPGIGQSTRGAVMAFAFGIPTAFIETNIRAVYLHHFFRGKSRVHDRDIMPLIEETLGRDDPRAWYYALMDYGVHLKEILPNPSRASRHHAKQSPFKGSNREERSRILKQVLAAGNQGIVETKITENTKRTRKETRENIDDLIREGFLARKLGRIMVRTTHI